MDDEPNNLSTDKPQGETIRCEDKEIFHRDEIQKLTIEMEQRNQHLPQSEMSSEPKKLCGSLSAPLSSREVDCELAQSGVLSENGLSGSPNENNSHTGEVLHKIDHQEEKELLTSREVEPSRWSPTSGVTTETHEYEQCGLALAPHLTSIDEEVPFYPSFIPPDAGTPVAAALAANAAIKVSKVTKGLHKLHMKKIPIKKLNLVKQLTKKIKKKRFSKNFKGKIIDGLHELYTLTAGMMLGVRCAVGRYSHQSCPDLTLEDFVHVEKLAFPPQGCSQPGNVTPPHSLAHTFKFKSYSLKVFRRLREFFGIDNAEYMMSVCGNYNYLEFISNSKSGQFFFYSHDGKYMIKTQTKEENKFMKRILPHYFKYVTEHPHTMLVRILGMHRVKMYHLRRKLHFVIMASVFDTPEKIHTIYDLKGSLIGRSATEAERRKGGVLKDNDMVLDGVKLKLGPKKQAFMTQLEMDAQFLAKLNIMDYSLLIGIHDRTKRAPPPPVEITSSANYRPRQITHSQTPFRRAFTEDEVSVSPEKVFEGGSPSSAGKRKNLSARLSEVMGGLSASLGVANSPSTPDVQRSQSFAPVLEPASMAIVVSTEGPSDVSATQSTVDPATIHLNLEGFQPSPEGPPRPRRTRSLSTDSVSSSRKKGFASSAKPRPAAGDVAEGGLCPQRTLMPPSPVLGRSEDSLSAPHTPKAADPLGTQRSKKGRNMSPRSSVQGSDDDCGSPSLDVDGEDYDENEEDDVLEELPEEGMQEIEIEREQDEEEEFEDHDDDGDSVLDAVIAADSINGATSSSEVGNQVNSRGQRPRSLSASNVAANNSERSMPRTEKEDKGKGATGVEGNGLINLFRSASLLTSLSKAPHLEAELEIPLDSIKNDIVTFGPGATARHPWTSRRDGGINSRLPDSSRGSEIYYVGVIDILQRYNLRKRTETFVRSLSYDHDLISSVDSKFYAKRFVKFVGDNTI